MYPFDQRLYFKNSSCSSFLGSKRLLLLSSSDAALLAGVRRVLVLVCLLISQMTKGLHS